MTIRLLVAAFAFGASVHAQTPELITLDAAVKRALAHPALVVAAATVTRAESGVRETRATRLPTLNLEANATQFEEPMVVAPLHGFDPRNPPVFDETLMQGSVNLAYALFDAARGARIARAEALAAAARTGASSASMQVIAEVTGAYLRVVSTREAADAHGHRITALEAERARARQLVEEGRAARVVLLRADAALSAARAEAVTSRTDVDIAENELARQLALTPAAVRNSALARVLPRREELPGAGELKQRARNAPDLQRAAHEIEAAAATRAEARGLWLPRVQLGGRFVEYASKDSRAQGEWQAGLQLSYPLITGGGRQAVNERAAAELRVARAQRELTIRSIDEAVDRALSTLVAARARASALEAAIAQLAEVARIDRLALTVGAGVQSDYLTAEADLLRARAALSDARSLEILALIELARITGELSEGWIAHNVETRS
ncbi:MAG: TolC family protein [Gemmatimonadota bacterium]